MRTNIVIDERLIGEAMKLARLKTKREAVQKALEGYVRDLKKRDLRDLKGKIRLADGYDYKEARKR
jgi:Arc/MetJ family transcription regulator